MQKQAETKTLTIYIYMDDSGKLSTKEKISVFAGIAFLDKAKKIRLLENTSLLLNKLTVLIAMTKKNNVITHIALKLKV